MDRLVAICASGRTDVGCGEFFELRAPYQWQQRSQDLPIRRDRLSRPAFEPMGQELIDSVLDGVSGRRADTFPQFVMDELEFVFDLRLGPADLTADALSVGAKSLGDRATPPPSAASIMMRVTAVRCMLEVDRVLAVRAPLGVGHARNGSATNW